MNFFIVYTSNVNQVNFQIPLVFNELPSINMLFTLVWSCNTSPDGVTTADVWLTNCDHVNCSQRHSTTRMPHRSCRRQLNCFNVSDVNQCQELIGVEDRLFDAAAMLNSMVSDDQDSEVMFDVLSDCDNNFIVDRHQGR